MNIILEKAKRQFDSNLPFVLYKKPNIDNLRAVFQKNDSLNLVHDFTEKGVVFASFDEQNILLIPENQSEVFIEKIEHQEIELAATEVDYSNEFARKNFESLVLKGKQAIQNNNFQKVVLSRKETLELTDFDLITTIRNLILSYSNAFAYCFYHPKIGLWFGASPEQLLQSNGIDFKTISLAGTQKSIDSENLFWKEKEHKEQQFVTDYIVSKLENATTQLTVSEPYSYMAGTLWHLKTDISGKIYSDFGLKKIVGLLHPTPAVCGMPKEETQVFIQENEGYKRTFYTGYLGELNCNSITDLFVNLRCMEIMMDTKKQNFKAHLFMGCGITKDSNLEKEWEESCNKSMTMRRLLV